MALWLHEGTQGFSSGSGQLSIASFQGGFSVTLDKFGFWKVLWHFPVSLLQVDVSKFGTPKKSNKPIVENYLKPNKLLYGKALEKAIPGSPSLFKIRIGFFSRTEKMKEKALQELWGWNDLFGANRLRDDVVWYVWRCAWVIFCQCSCLYMYLKTCHIWIHCNWKSTAWRSLTLFQQLHLRCSYDLEDSNNLNLQVNVRA